MADKSEKKEKKKKADKSPKEPKEKKMKVKKETEEAQTDVGSPSTETVLVPAEAGKGGVSIIANPLADDKLLKRTLKVVQKASKRKQIKRGVKEVVKALRKNTKGLCILAGDISPIDVITHLPVLCEERDVPYVFVPSKEALGAAGLTKRPTSCMLVLPKPLKGGTDDEESAAFDESYQELAKKLKAVQPVY